MPLTQIADLWVPDIWVQGVAEKANKLPMLINSPAVVRSPEFDALAGGGGTSVNVPFYKDFTDEDDEIQVEDTAPTPAKLGSGLQNAPMLNRVKAIATSALAAGVSGSDPAGYMMSRVGEMRNKQKQKVLVNVLRGLFGTAMTSVDKAIHTEDGNAAGAANLIDADAILDAVALLGELSSVDSIGAIWVHPTVVAALRKQDETAFEPVSRQGTLWLETYKGVPLYQSLALSRAGTTTGTVYETYLFGRGAIATGAKPQSTIQDRPEVAQLVMDYEAGKNNATMYDRNRYLVHLAGTKWTGTPAGQSATNAELATAGNWSLVYQTADRCGSVRVTSNG